MLSKFIIVLTTSWSTSQAKRHTFTMSERSWPSCLTTKLYVKGNKCKFHVSRISFLGYIKSTESVFTDQDKVTAVTNSPVPTTVKELQRFLGFTNFNRKFICWFSIIASPLTFLLKKGPKKLKWNTSKNQAFEWLMEDFTSASYSNTLTPPCFS